MKLYDVHICTTNGLSIKDRNIKIISYTTPHYNLPYLIARSKIRNIGKTKTTFPIALPNGTEVMKYFNDKKLKQWKYFF